jgi:hypothetical protein
MSDKLRSFAIYKANNAKTGSAAQFSLSSNKDCVFLEFGRQINERDSPAPYDWENKITVKLGFSDLGKILLLLNGRGPEKLDLFHKNQKGNKVLSLQAQDNGYYMKVSAKEGDSGPASIATPISFDESVLLKLTLERAFHIILGW